MKQHSLQLAIEQAHSEGRKAIIPFLTAGFPNEEKFWAILQELDDAGSDIIEIGVPFSDPVADGPLIENASREAIERGVTLPWIISGLMERSGQFRAKIVLMGYTNPFYQYGLERLADDCVKAGIAGAIIPDIQLGESGMFRDVFEPRGLALITLVSPNTSAERMREYASVSQGFIYVTAVLGVTGGESDITASVASTMKRARENFDLPLALGFGLHSPLQLAELPEESQPDAAVFGSALLKHIEAGKPVKDFLAPWK